MEGFPNQETALRLIYEAAAHADQLGGTYTAELLPHFEQAQDTLAAPTEAATQLTLIVSAARMAISQVEKKTIRLIIGDDPVTGKQMSHLVRIRLICAELINLLNQSLETIKQAMQAKRQASVGS